MSSDFDIVPRYASKADIYGQYRWSFDAQAVNALLERLSLNANAVVADIGAGTGMSSKPFLEAGRQVYAVEPGPDMRRAAEREFAALDNFHSVDGRAEASGLPADSVDLIVAGRALHWFSPYAAREEFKRIAKPNGWLAALSATCEDTDLLAARKQLQQPELGWDVEASKSHRQFKPLEFFFDDAGFEEIQSARTIQETFPEYLGRIGSFAGAPGPENSHYGRFEATAREIFDRFQENGSVSIPVKTRIRYGRPFGLL